MINFEITLNLYIWRFRIIMSNIIVHPILGNFKILDEIGEGSFSTVYKCKHDECDVPVAIKVLEEELPLDESDSGSFSSQSTQPHNSNNSSLSDIDKNKIVNAFELEKRFSHPLICEGYDMFTWNNKTCLIHEMVEGETLLDHLNNFAPLEEVAIQTFLGQLVVILNYLHNTVHVIHRDLKCENVIVDIYRNIRLIDFGFACSSDESLHTTICGSPAYIAPEMILNQPYDYSVDIWSLGVIVYAMAFGYLPFDDPNILNNMQSILNDEPEYPNTVSSVLIDLIKRMLEKDPKKRITIEEISQHQFFCEDPFGRNYLFDLCAFETISNEMKKSINKCLKMTPPIPRGTLSSSVPLVNPCTSLGDI
ncbi:CAMK family protein kinase [Tritrichomonas foetus]|uniref:CAMK family protein kinase n=1 Tax=Tritrichomonas foetus TaxID=1144522 RepID=A0A1J4JWC3_9EUKA|nr:CAMK family protein kinase [Tritrichomonas foetus]|eukprot:OHT01828.1 CAMK family protein kinase [Tritrichomonas foetus]